MLKKVLCFGELLLRICPDPSGNWLNSNDVPAFIGGAELNVATALALWNIPSAYLTALPENEMSDQIRSYLEEKRIDTSRFRYEGERIGLYYLAMGTDMKNAKVIYDRKHSSFAGLKKNTIDWEQVFEGIGWFHFSAICPAINEEIAGVCKEALHMAEKIGISISLDLNYREKLWKYGKPPVAIMKDLAIHCRLIMGNIWAAELMLGIPKADDFVLRHKEFCLQQAEKTSLAIQQQFPACEAVANTFRFDKGEGIQYYTTLYTANNLYTSQEYNAKKVINKVGSGDCYMAGLIYGFHQNYAAQEIVEFATAAAYYKLFTPGDSTAMNVDQITTRLNQLL
ncbi:sugar kinase [Pedobacter cryoconitis]|uniref:2-dehydro-3-deoxygluconokinase n=1 Tax=Pedobacter cryoconitis TaxID=188932 RepID=A0A327SVN0_9SPHI|nr:sugar kinase [Pedobacter cryoconitis]RAJ32978.1 2-dehydro-3-deoxygluconokinase [Pedobacter cryoconitis]